MNEQEKIKIKCNSCKKSINKKEKFAKKINKFRIFRKFDSKNGTFLCKNCIVKKIIIEEELSFWDFLLIVFDSSIISIILTSLIIIIISFFVELFNLNLDPNQIKLENYIHKEIFIWVFFSLGTISLCIVKNYEYQFIKNKKTN